MDILTEKEREMPLVALQCLFVCLWCSDVMECECVFDGHVLFSSTRKDRVPKMRDHHHGKLSFVALLYGIRSDHETTACMHSLYIVYYCSLHDSICLWRNCNNKLA